MTLIIGEFSGSTYNELLDVHDANRRLTSFESKHIFFNSAKGMILESEVSSALGICLLHKHYPLPDGFCMEESAVSDGESAALEMAPVELNKRQGVPISWKVVADKGKFALVPLEYSREEYAKTLYLKIITNSSTLERLACLIVKMKMTDVLGLAILRQGQIEQHGYDLIERTNDKRSTHVTKPEMLNGDEDETIETLWKFELVVDPVLGCVQRCIPFSQCMNSGYGHSREWFHNPDHPTSY